MLQKSSNPISPVFNVSYLANFSRNTALETLQLTLEENFFNSAKPDKKKAKKHHLKIKSKISVLKICFAKSSEIYELFNSHLWFPLYPSKPPFHKSLSGTSVLDAIYNLPS